MSYCSSLSLSRNSIYSIHYSYYSISISGCLISLFLFLWIILCSWLSFLFPFLSLSFLFFFIFLSLSYLFLFLIPFSFFNSFFNSFDNALFLLVSFLCNHIIGLSQWLACNLFLFLFILCGLLFVLLFLFVFLWVVDLCFESCYGFTLTEQYSLVYGIKLLIFSEWMLFFACFWGLFDFRFILNGFCLFFCFPLLSSYCFAIPYSNVIVLIFSSLPIQSCIIFYKVGLFIGCVEQLGQTISCGIVFLVLQIKEFLFSYLSITDCMIGSIFYFTTGLHGAHVFMGLLYFFVIMLLLSNSFHISLSNSSSLSLFYSCLLFKSFILLYYESLSKSILFIEYSFSFFFSSYYWHFVDWIWFFVFMVFFVAGAM